MLRRKFRGKIASGILAMTLFMSFLTPQTVNAYSNNDRVSSVKELAEKYKSDIENSVLELKTNPIREGVDTTTEEYQSIIVEFNSLPLIMQEALNSGAKSKKASEEIESEHKTFEKFLASKSKEKSETYTINYSYYNTYNGVSMSVKGTDIESLLESGVVKAIWKDEEVKANPVSTEVVTYSVNENDLESRMITSTPLVGVDKLRDEGITGSGIKVGVLDTGIDYNHPDLKDNYKGGYDFIDNDNDPMETTYEEWLASGEEEYIYTSSYYTYHGTHVAGTIGATGANTESEFAVTGLAPDVDLYAYRVLGPYGSGATAGILAAIEQSIKDEMDVINLSLGITTTDALYPTSVACNNATLAGVVTVVANGNAGPELSTLGSPGTSPLSISVGASSTDISVDTFDVNLSNGDVVNGRLFGRSFESLDGFVAGEYEVVYGGLGNDYELEEANVEGKVVLIDRGEITLIDKHTNAFKAGAAGVLFANNVENEEINLYLGEASDRTPSIAITKEEGDQIKALLEETTDSGEPLKVTFNVTGKAKTEPDILASFSSRGPSSDETIKPDVVAPGDGIFSTYPEYVNSPEEGIDYSYAYSRISGTSMASPHVAGIAALMLQNDKSLTPEEVKVALMNSCVDLKGDYPINAVGAGRVDAYKAVHNDVSISVIDKCNSYDENNELIELEYITGSLSFDRMYIDEEASERTIGLQLKNDSDTDKNFNVSVRYLGEEALAQNAEANGVKLEVAQNLSVGSGKAVDFDANIKIPAGSDLGRYEGYITLTNSDDSSEVYKVPFSATYMKPGLNDITLSRYAVSNDLEMMHFAKLSGIVAYVSVASPLRYMEVYVKDYETNERIGLVGLADLSSIPAGFSNAFYALDSRASYFPMDENGDVTYIKRSLTDGKYNLEFIAHSDETEEVFEYSYGVLVDNEDVTMTVDKEPGVYEITEDMMTTEEYMGQEYTAFWIHGNVDDNSISELQEMGYEANKQDILVSGFLNGMPNFSLNVDENGDFMIGFEEGDIRGNVMEFSPMATDMATSQNIFLPPRYFFVKEGTPYTSVTLDKGSMLEGENIVSTIGVNNLGAGSTFNFGLQYMRSFELMDVRINDELQKIVDENNYKVTLEKSIDGEVNRILQLNLSVTDKDGKKVNLSNDISLLDVELKLVDDSECEFYKEYIQCSSVEILDKDDNYAEMSYTSTYEGVNIKQNSSTVRTIQAAQGAILATERGKYTSDLNKYTWVEDNKGNKYELEYYANNDEYVAFNLPVSTEEYKVVSNYPGHFRKEARFVPSRVLNGEVLGKVYYLLGSEFYMYAFAGDANGDDVIDIHDAVEVAKYYGQKVDYNEVSVDFNFDGIVNADDMDFVIYNYLVANEQNLSAPEGEQYYEGKTLEDILNEVGYYDEIRLEELTISETDITLELNDPENNTKQLVATMNPENVPNIGLQWKVKNEEIATVDQNGLVTAVNPGRTVVEVAATDGSVRLYCYVNVTRDGEVPYIESAIAKNSNLEVVVGDEFDLEFTLNPEDVAVKSVRYISSADSIVSIVDGKAVAKSEGKAIVTVSINEGEAFVTWEITVKSKDDNGSDDGDDDSDNKPGNDNNDSGNGNGSNNGGQSSNNKPGVNVKPDKDNGKLPSTGGRAVLPIVVSGVVIIAGGIYTLKKRK
ncbi:S8 family serine peptidase [Clostridium sp. D53t1_180928_C8]|uniref:S8 family serine peptidase n=1 Tax=Clostridium sp. D53t1_180928_C8 TaxID=2787101 RepID=UPI0018A94EA0|nr:S8 family serine peptidase [Clostridium sp. D53t1_180928_C8]